MFHALASHALHWSFDLAGVTWLERFQRSLTEAPDHNEALLARILQENRDTDYGRRHGFADVRGPHDYARRVPLTDYESYRDLVQRIADGEANVLTAEQVKYLGLSSGTTGRGKLVPVTGSAQGAIIAHMMLTPTGVQAARHPAREAGPGLLLMSSALAQVSKGGIPIGTATAAGMDRMKGIAELLWASPLPVSRVRSQPVANHLHALFALAQPRLSSLTAPFLCQVLDLLQTVERDWRGLCDELERGEVAPHPDLDEAVRAQLRLVANPARAAAVRAECERGFEGVVPRLWPNLKMVVGVMSGSFRVYERPVRRYLGGLPIHSAMYASSEGLLGVALEPESVRYALVPDSCYFEFLSVAEADVPHPATRTLREVRAGETYELVLTTRSGLYRYRLGDVVQVVGFAGRTPLVEFSHRRGQLLDLAAEKTSERTLRDALLETCRQLGVELVDYTTRADAEASPRRYEVFLELGGDEAALSLDRAQHVLDAALQLGNPGYAVVRRGGVVGPPVVHRVTPGTFAAVRERLVADGASPAQVKVPRVLVQEPLLALVRGRVRAPLASDAAVQVREARPTA